MTGVKVKQLGYCNAYVRSWYDADEGMYIDELVSYCTPVCRVLHAAMGSRPVIVSLGSCAKCSATTWKHVTRFMRAYAPSLDYVLVEYARMHGQGWFNVNYDYVYDSQHDRGVNTLLSAYAIKRTFPAWRTFVNGVYEVKGMHK